MHYFQNKYYIDFQILLGVLLEWNVHNQKIFLWPFIIC